MEIDFLQLSLGVLLGVFLTSLYFLNRTQKSSVIELDSNHQQTLRNLENQKGKIEGQLTVLHSQVDTSQKKQESQSQEIQELIAENGKLIATNEALSIQLNDAHQIEKNLKEEFEVVANKIFQNNSQHFHETSHRSLKGILEPLQEKMVDFKREINEKYLSEAKDKASLKTEISKLVDLNTKLSKEAHQLAHALKGDNKQQGNWGEVILEKVLERSGLEKGTEFHTQQHIQSENGSTKIPDAVIYLPDNKHIIIDSKVSLVAYERMINAETEAQAQKELKLHLVSLKSHIKDLSDKRYYDNEQFNSPEFTLLFIPIEGSFSSALKEDTELFHYAWDRNIVIVSPTTLLATLRTVASIWTHEKQTKYVLEIAKEGGALHDKFVGFVDELERIEKNLSQTQTSFQGALKKLHTGKGNIINRVNRLKTLGAKANKSLSSELIEKANQSHSDFNSHE